MKIDSGKNSMAALSNRLFAFCPEVGLWFEILTQSEENKPSARNFHSSVLIGSDLFIFGGKNEQKGEKADQGNLKQAETGQNNSNKLKQTNINKKKKKQFAKIKSSSFRVSFSLLF